MNRGRFLLLAVAVAIYAPARAVTAPDLRQRVVIVFDPTFDTDDPRSLTLKLTKALGAGDLVPENSQVLMWISGESMMNNSSPIAQRTFQFNPKNPTSSEHDGEVKLWLDDQAKIMAAKSIDAHSTERVGRRASCLLSALYCISDYLDNSLQKAERTDLVLVSDLMENCVDWGDKGINLEKSVGDPAVNDLSELLISKDLKQLIFLKRISQVYVLVQPSKYINNPRQRARLQAAWKKTFDTLDAKNVSFLPGIPEALIRAAK